jgi:hypothetical protein
MVLFYQIGCSIAIRLAHKNAKYGGAAIARAARLQRGSHPCGALQFTRAPDGSGSLEGF